MRHEAEIVIFQDHVSAAPEYTDRYIAHLYFRGDRYAIYGRQVTVNGMWIYRAVWLTSGVLCDELDDYWFIGNFEQLLLDRFELPVDIVRITYCEQSLNQYESLIETGHLDDYLEQKVLRPENFDLVEGVSFFNRIMHYHRLPLGDMKYRYVYKKPTGYFEDAVEEMSTTEKPTLIDKLTLTFSNFMLYW